MGYPIWQTPAGNLGKIAAQQFFDLALSAVDPEEIGTISYSLVAGLLPKGLQINDHGYMSGNPAAIYTLQGVPFSTNQDIVSTFTIRAKNSTDNSISDRTFTITVTGNFPPEIITDVNPLGIFLDGTEVNLQLEAIDLNVGDVLTWSLINGSLPPGLEFTESGLIKGVCIPVVSDLNNYLTGWSESSWSKNAWEFAKQSSNSVYNFTVGVTDGKARAIKQYVINVYAFNDLRADNNVITADNSRITSDVDSNRPPILITRDLGIYSTVNSGGYFAFQFKGIDYDGYPVQYNLTTGNNSGWDNITLNWDMGVWDVSNQALPPGLVLDTNTGWMTGYIPAQAETSITYTFGVYVNSTVGDYVSSQPVLFEITILGNLDLAIDWITDNDLGTLNTGSISNLGVQAVAASGLELIYVLENDSRLPQGLKLLPDGTISGRLSFQTMDFDQGKTTFDKDLAARYIYSNPTNFDNIYTFKVTAHDFNNQISASKTFRIRINSISYEPYEDLYVKCLPSINNRELLNQLIQNTDIFDPEDVYRPQDPYFGISSDIKFLVSYGIKASSLSDYTAVMKTRHFPKKFFFGDYKLAQGKDINGNVLYDLIYVDLIEDTKIYETINGATKKLIPPAFTNITEKKPTWKNPLAPSAPQNKLVTSNYLPTIDAGYVRTNDSYWLKDKLDQIAPNDLTLMQVDISNSLESTYLNSLPEWMISIQSNNKILGYTSGAVLAYLKPNTGAKALYRINKYAPFDIKVVPFVADRYVLNNNYSDNFNIETRKFVTHKYTTFDQTVRGGLSINSVATVSFAVNRPFDSINNQTLDYIIDTGGLDGVTYNLDGKYLIFATQEAFIGWSNEVNDGWNNNQYTPGNYRWDETVGWEQDVWDKYNAPANVLIPGYLEKVNLLSLVNQRGGIWKISINSENVVQLTFDREISLGSYIYVTEGNTHSNSYQLYDPDTLQLGYVTPQYTQTFSSVLKPRAKTTFDHANTIFINNVDTYTIPLQGDKYLKFPKIGVFTNGQ